MYFTQFSVKNEDSTLKKAIFMLGTSCFVEIHFNKFSIQKIRLRTYTLKTSKNLEPYGRIVSVI